MSYCVTGRGELTLRYNSAVHYNLTNCMQAYYDRQCQIELEAADSDLLKDAIRRVHQTKKGMLKGRSLNRLLRRELSEANFTDIELEEDTDYIYIDISIDGEYYENRIMPLLELLAPHLESGKIVFRGEDGFLWRLLFTATGWIEQVGKTVYLEKSNDPTESQTVLPYPPVNDTDTSLPVLISEIQSRMQSDKRPAIERSRQLFTAIQNRDPEGVLAALTNCSLWTLGTSAGIWGSATNTQSES